MSRLTSLPINVLYMLHCIIFAPLSKISWLYSCGSISGLSILFHWSVYSSANTTLSSQLLVSLNSGKVCPTTLSFFSALFEHLRIDFWISLLTSTKSFAGMLTVALTLWIKLGIIEILTILGLPIHKHRISLHLKKKWLTC